MAKILLTNVRLAFPDLWRVGKPIPGSVSPPKFGASLIFAPDSDAAKVAKAEFVKVATEKFGANAVAIIQALATDKKCLRSGDTNLAKDGSVRDGFGGNLYLVARNKTRPVVVDQRKHPLSEEDGKPYGGCFVNVTVDIYAHEKPGLGKRIDATLLAVQFAKDGDAFGGSVGSADDFGEIGDDAGGDAADLF